MIDQKKREIGDRVRSMLQLQILANWEGHLVPANALLSFTTPSATWPPFNFLFLNCLLLLLQFFFIIISHLYYTCLLLLYFHTNNLILLIFPFFTSICTHQDREIYTYTHTLTHTSIDRSRWILEEMELASMATEPAGSLTQLLVYTFTFHFLQIKHIYMSYFVSLFLTFLFQKLLQLWSKGL